VPGSGEIGAGMDVVRLVSQIIGGGESTHEASTSAEPGKGPASEAAQSGEHDATQRPPDLPTQALRLDNETISMREEPRNSEAGSGVETKRAKASESNSIAPQQARRHG
jgi:hypothetical protein